MTNQANVEYWIVVSTLNSKSIFKSSVHLQISLTKHAALQLENNLTSFNSWNKCTAMSKDIGTYDTQSRDPNTTVLLQSFTNVLKTQHLFHNDVGEYFEKQSGIPNESILHSSNQ